MNSSNVVDVFPISTAAFGFPSDWFETFVPRLVRPSFLLMILLLVISIGIMTLKRFQHADLEKKVWNIPVVITASIFWPFLVMGLKDLVDTFNTFLVQDIFRMQWAGFGYPDMGSLSNFMGWTAEGLARLLPNFAYWLVYAFYLIFFFFFAVLGPFVLAKGILFDEVDAFLELVKELVMLLLWQTTLVILVSFIMPDIVTGKPFPARPEANFYFLSVILGMMIFFVPSITRKFGNHFGSSFFPPGFRWGGALVGLAAVGKLGSYAIAATGLPFQKHHWAEWKHRLLNMEEFRRRAAHQRHIEDLEHEKQVLQVEVKEFQQKEDENEFTAWDPDSHNSRSLVDLSKRAKEEMRWDKKP